MHKELYIKNPLTERERMWIDNFHAHETPASLNLADDFIETLKHGDKVLDIGCAFGRMTNYLADNKGVKVTGIDINPAEIAYARQNCPSSLTKFKVMDGTRLKFRDNSMSKAILVGTCGGVEQNIREKLVGEAYRVIEPGGALAIAEFRMNLNDLGQMEKYNRDKEITGEWGSRIIRRNNKILFIARHFLAKELIDMLLKAGFQFVELREHYVESLGVGDNGDMKKRAQYTVWGFKPLIFPIRNKSSLIGH
jgi:ubiquinone/menaquinone biosynthesis C-methylase UbiE